MVYRALAYRGVAGCHNTGAIRLVGPVEFVQGAVVLTHANKF